MRTLSMREVRDTRSKLELNHMYLYIEIPILLVRCIYSMEETQRSRKLRREQERAQMNRINQNEEEQSNKN